MPVHYRISALAFVALACGGSGKHEPTPTDGGGGMTNVAGTVAQAGSHSAGTSSAGSSSAGASHAGSGGAPGSGGAAASGGASGAAPGGGVGGALDPETLGCAKWMVNQRTTPPVTATPGPDGLVLVSPAGVSSFGSKFGDFSLVQAGLSGDFDVTVSWQDFVPGEVNPAKGPKFAAGIFWYEPDGAVYSSVGKVGGGTTQASLIHGDQFTINSLSPLEAPAWYEGASGSFRLQRSGTTVTMTSKVNDKSVMATSTEPFPEQPLELALWFESDTSTSTSTKPSGVTITSVQVAGGGGLVKPDDFSCP